MQRSFFALRGRPSCFLAAQLLLVSLACGDRPNVLFIAIDDLVPTLGVYGDPLAQTPEMDSLAAQGTTFLNHHVQWSVCGPSRAALTTSLMPEETGVIGFKAIRHPDWLPDVTTLPQHFRNQGYETACSGKFHDNRTVGDTTQPLDPGSGQFPDGNSVDDPASWSIPWRGGGSGFTPPGKPAVDYSNDNDADFIDYDILSNGLALIDTLAAGDKPFFLAVGFKKPHLAFIAPTKYWDLYDTDGDGNYDDDFPLPNFTDDPASASAVLISNLDRNGEILGYEPFDTTGMPTESEVRELRHGYYACVSFIDALIGQLINKLEATDDPVQPGRKLSETTIVVLWGDHGFYLGEHDRWAKHGATERATAAPLIIFDPRRPTAGATTMSPVNAVDLYPTLCELAGLPLPEQPLNNSVSTGRPLRGRSLVPVLEDPETLVHGGAISHFNWSGASGYAYRTERYRYIEWISGTSVERDLFDIRQGDVERVDLADDPAYATVIYELSRAMRAEPTTLGMEVLQSAEPFEAPVDFDPSVPGVEADLAAPDKLSIRWPGMPGVTYRLRGTTDLTLPWSTLESSLNGSLLARPITEDREFFKIELDENQPPRFLEDPVVADVAQVDQPFSSTLAGFAVDPDVGDSLTYALVDGPAWLSLDPNGALSGTPLNADLGASYTRISATDNHGATIAARLQITVEEAPVDNSVTLSFAPTADVFIKESDPDANFGANKWLELTENADSGVRRYSFLRFDLSGIPAGATVTGVEFFLTPNSEGGMPFPEYGLVDVYEIVDNTWDASQITWNNTLTTLRSEVDDGTTPIATLVNSTGSSGAEQSVDLSATGWGAQNGSFSLGLRTQDQALGRFSSSDHATEPNPRLEVTYVE